MRTRKTTTSNKKKEKSGGGGGSSSSRSPSSLLSFWKQTKPSTTLYIVLSFTTSLATCILYMIHIHSKSIIMIKNNITTTNRGGSSTSAHDTDAYTRQLISLGVIVISPIVNDIEQDIDKDDEDDDDDDKEENDDNNKDGEEYEEDHYYNNNEMGDGAYYTTPLDDEYEYSNYGFGEDDDYNYNYDLAYDDDNHVLRNDHDHDMIDSREEMILFSSMKENSTIIEPIDDQEQYESTSTTTTTTSDSRNEDNVSMMKKNTKDSSRQQRKANKEKLNHNTINSNRRRKPNTITNSRIRRIPPVEIIRQRKRNITTGPVYKPTGGKLPIDDHQLYPNPLSWPSIDNGTCIVDTYNANPAAYPWQSRAPLGIILGTMKGGTQALSEYLWEHPMIVSPITVGRNRPKYELHFFDTKDFIRDSTGIPQRKNQISYAHRFMEHYPSFFKQQQQQQRKNNRRNKRRQQQELLLRKKGKLPPDPPIVVEEKSSSLFSVVDSPRYLLWSDRTPDAILCVTPWAKLIAVLRDPVDRAISHFKYLDQERRWRRMAMVDWEPWIEDDLRLLREAGVVMDWSVIDFNSYAGSDDEYNAWKKYLRNPNSNMILGRGLYTIQLEHYYAAMDRVGKSRSDLLVIRSEDLRVNTQRVYDETLSFLGLPPNKLKNPKKQHHRTMEGAVPLPDHLRTKLEKFFEPYNRRLCRLLDWTDDDCFSYDSVSVS